MGSAALEVTGLRHRYGDRESLRGLGFSVSAGDMFALLGPNGGGKTTLFRIISTLIAPTSGTVEVFGIDVTKQPAEARKAMRTHLTRSLQSYRRLAEGRLHAGRSASIGG